MPREISPLAIRMQVAGSRQAEGQIRQFAGSFELVNTKADQATDAVKATGSAAREIVMQARGVQNMESSIEGVGKEATGVTRRFADMTKKAREFGDGIRDAANDMKQLAQDAVHAAHAVHKVWEVGKALHSASPIKLLDSVIPEATKRKVGTGMIASGVGLSALLGTTISPAMEKQVQTTSITALAGNDEAAAKDIYKATDDASISSVFNLPELVSAAKILTRDRQFSTRNLRALDDLAATDPDQFKPEDAARALGRIRVGETGEGLERLRDMGLSRQDLEKKGIKYDAGGAIEDKTPEGITRLIDAIIATIEERFGGLSEKLATTTLAGAVSNMEDAIGRFATSIGETFIPALNWGANTIRALATWFAELPEPVKQVIAWTAAFTAGVLILGGTLLIIGGTIAKAIIIWKALSFVLGLFGTSIPTLTLSILNGLLPALATWGLAIGLLAIVAVAGATAIKGAADTSSKAAGDVIERWGIMGKLWISLGDWLTAFMNHKIWGWIGKVLDPANLFGLRDNGKAKGDDADRQQWERDNRRRRKRGERERTFEEFIGDVNGDEYTASKKPKEGQALASKQEEWAKSYNKADIANKAIAALMGGPSSPLMIGAATAEVRGQQSASVQAAQGTVDSLQAEIYALQDKKRNATKEEKKLIEEQLVQKQRQLSAARTELASAKKLAAQDEREAKQAEREAKKLEKQTDKDDLLISKAAIDIRRAEQIAALQDQLDKAKEDADGARIYALTKQIERAQADQQYDESMAAAAQQEPGKHRQALEKIASMNREADYRRAERAATKAKFQAENSGSKKQSLTPAEIRAIFNATGASMLGQGDNGALGSGINYGDRFADTKESLWGQSEMQAMREGIAGAGDFGNSRAQMDRERKIKVRSMKQKSNGNHVVKFVVEDLEIPAGGFDEVVF